jgi:putative adhesin
MRQWNARNAMPVAALALAAALLGIPAEDAHPRSQGGGRRGAPFHWSGRLERGQRIEIQGINGAIVAERAAGGQVVVEAERSARRSDPDDVRIDVTEDDRGVRICARYPRPGGGLNDCDGRNEVRDNDVQVKFRLRLPAGVDAMLRTVNGGVDAVGLASALEVATVNGSIEISTTGTAEAATVNGSIRARLGSADFDHGAEFNTVNGDIRLELPGDADAHVTARTMHGDIDSDFPLVVRGRFTAKRVNGTIGRGGPELTLETVNGSIRLRSI